MFAANASFRIPFDPITLSYVMALRGVRSRLPNEPFAYAELGCGNAERLILLAACNPEGTFFGFDPSLEALNKAAEQAERYGIKNLTFSQASAAALKDAVAAGVISKNSFDYLVYNEIGSGAREDMQALALCARQLLRPNGVFAYRYRTYAEPNAEELLFKSLTPEFLKENAEKGEDAAKDWGRICLQYFNDHPQEADAFNQALLAGKGVQWLKDAAGTGARPSKVLDVAAAMGGGELTLMGSALIAANYMELAAPELAHAVLAASRQHRLYEAYKDMAMNSAERVDIWAKEPLQRTENLVTLFGAFTFGTTESDERIARTVTFQGRNISFMGPLYDSILSLATVMPVTIGDLVHHESLKGVDAMTILNSVQLLVACGVLQPMRASYDGGVDMSAPQLMGAYNESLRGQQLDFQDYAFASTVVGRPVVFSGMNTLVLQAFDKGGLQNIAALMGDELMRLSKHPYLRPLGLDQPERAIDEGLRQIENVFNQSVVRWFSMGIIASQD